MSGLSKQIFIIFLIIEVVGEIAISSEEAVQYTAESFGLHEVGEKILN